MEYKGQVDVQRALAKEGDYSPSLRKLSTTILESPSNALKASHVTGTGKQTQETRQVRLFQGMRS
jgi:hypothetical protein